MTRSWSRTARAASLTFLPLVLAASAVSAEAQSNNGNSRVRTREMNGFQEVTPSSVMTTGVGEFEAKIINDAVIEYTLSYAGLEGGPVTQAHIHFGRDGTSGGVAVWLCGGGTKPAPCPPAGTVTGVITPADVVGPLNQGIEPGRMDELIRALRTGTAYANVHTARFLAGEIRGQIRDDRDVKDTP